MAIYGGGWLPSTQAFIGGLVADAGEYLGPWPPQPILEQNLPDAAREIDYLIALPNPDGDPDHAADSNYPTVYFQEWIYRDNSGNPVVANTGIQQSGNAMGTDRPDGAHLYVGWFSTGAVQQPTVSPQAVVPQGWTIAARGWARGEGRWSDWQSGYIFDDVVTATMRLANGLDNGLFTSYRSDAGEYPAIDADIRALIDTVSDGGGDLASEQAPGNLTISMALIGCRGWLAASDAYFGYAFAPPDTWARSDYIAATFDAATVEDQLPAFAPPLPPDAEPPPPEERDVSFGVIQFEGDRSAFFAWQDTTFDHGKFTYYTDDLPANRSFAPAGPPPDTPWFVPPAETPFIFGITDPLTPLGEGQGNDLDGMPLHVAPRIAARDLDVLTTVSFPADSAPSHPDSDPYTFDYTVVDGTAVNLEDIDVSVDLPLSQVTRKHFSLVAMSGYFDDAPLPFADGVTSQPFFFLAQLWSFWGNSAGFRPSFFNYRTLRVSLRTPSWRYWTYDRIPAIELPPAGARPQSRNVAWV